MITHGGILTAYCKAKEAILKSLHTVWFHIYDILEKTNYEDSKKVSGCQWLVGRKGWIFLAKGAIFHSCFLCLFQNWITGKVVVAVMLVLITLALLLNNRNQHTLWVHFTTGLREVILWQKEGSVSCTEHISGQLQTLATQAVLGKNGFKVGGDKVPRYSHALNSSLTSSLNSISFSHRNSARVKSRVLHHEFFLLNRAVSPVPALTGSSLPCDSSVNMGLYTFCLPKVDQIFVMLCHSLPLFSAFYEWVSHSLSATLNRNCMEISH